MNNSNCTTCGQSIKNIITIDGLHYGTTCAEKLDGDRLPYKGFTGDVNQWEKRSEENKLDHLATIALTKDSWGALRYLSKALRKARGNDWETNFVYSVCQSTYKVGGLNYIRDYKTMEAALSNWNSDYMGSFPYVRKKGKTISEKQQSILERILDKI